MGVLGVSHQYFLNKNTYVHTVVSYSHDNGQEDADTLNPNDGYVKIPVVHTSSSNSAIRASVMYNQKMDARNTFRTGVVAQQMSYDMDYNAYDNTERQWKNFLAGSSRRNSTISSAEVTTNARST